MSTSITELKEDLHQNNTKKAIIIILSLILLVLVILISISVGPIRMSLEEVINVLFFGQKTIIGPYGEPIDVQNVVFNLRLPRVLCAMLIGAALAVSGAAMQGIFRNPMASPSVLGISSGAAFGACLSIIFGFSIASGSFAIPSMAFIFSFITLFLVYSMARTKMGVPISMLLLSGIAVGAFFNGLVSLLQYYADDKLEGIVFWLMGNLNSCGWDQFFIILLPILVGSIVLMFYSKELNLLSLGDDQATNLGVNVERTRIIILVASALTVAGAVAVSGVIGFVGLIVPHIFRMLLGPDHRLLIPMSIVGGAIFMVIMDALSRVLVAPAELPVGILTAILGAPFFIYILRTRKKEIWGN